MITIPTFATNGYFCPNVASYYKAGMTEQEYCKPYIQKLKDCEQPGICNRKLFTDQRNLITIKLENVLSIKLINFTQDLAGKLVII